MSNHLTTSSDLSLRDAALAHAYAGYEVIPLRVMGKGRRCRCGTQPSSDPTVVAKWWARMWDSNIGLVLDLLMVVVIDVDGPIGVASLAWLLRQAGLDTLPATYTVTTGRPDGGRHYWFRLPAGAVKLFNQIGGLKSQTPGLDVLFQGVVVAAGSVHKSGVVYRGNMAEMPVPSMLPELPTALYGVLARSGRPKVAGVVSRPPRYRRAPLVGYAPSPASNGACEAVIPDHIKRWLADGSDHRNDRTFKAVTGLVGRGLDDQDIIRTVFTSVLGDKAREEADPQGYLQQKINSARRYVPVVLDRNAFWVALHTSGMSASKVRLLDALLARSTESGFVCLGQDWMGIRSAISSPGGVVRVLIQKGWLVVLTAGSLDHPTCYRLAIPDVGLDVKTHLQVCPTPPASLSQWGLKVLFPVDHDAFRCRKGSLHLAYLLLSLLRNEPQSMGTLAGWLRVKPRVLMERARALISAGLVVQCEDGLALTGDSVLPLLHAVAVKVGTDGYRLRSIESYRAKAEEWKRSREEAGQVGSPTWRKIRLARILAKIDEGDLAAIVEHFDGDVDAAAAYVVESDIAAMSPDRESTTIGWASLAADLRGCAS